MKSLKSGVLLVSVLWATASFAQGVNLGGGNKFRGLGPDATPSPTPTPSSSLEPAPGVSQLLENSAKEAGLLSISLPACEWLLGITKAAPADLFGLLRPMWAEAYSYYKDAPASKMKDAKLDELRQNCDEVKMDIATSNAYVGYDKSVVEQKLQSDLSSFEQAMKQAGDNMGSAKGKFAGSAQ